MFEGLSGRLGDIFDRLRKRGALSEADVGAALREVRVALLEADVALPVVKDFVDKARERAVGAEVLRSVTPGQQVIKIVHDCLIEMLGGTPGEAPDLNAATPINLVAVPPVPVLMVGLQGSGKTTTTGKLALRLKDRDNRKVLMASLDTRRPAAQEQLKILGEQIGVTTLPIVPGQEPLAIARRAMERGRLEGFDVVLLDTAGRLAIDEELMAEVVAIRDATKPTETLLVADAMTGQDAVNVARTFHERVGVTGIVLTRVDGDSRGGAALSMRAVTGQPIKLIGVGEKMDALELFHPDRIANRILGMGDVVSLVERAAQTIEKEDAEKLAAKIQKGEFDLEDLASQLRQMRKMGGLQGLMGMLPGVGKIKDQMKTAGMDDKMIKRQEAIISSMTPVERRNPKIIHAKRKVRIAAGSGTSVQDVNKLLKQHQQMADMMKRMKKLGKAGMMRGMPKLPPGMLPPGFKM
ncbi:signal recognition particle subunit SRP54 [Inquilinus ginsengisoli]|uniref:signal recognition particle protein n=1 Tax=Inquilinus ginsengisoli TaxID=363840 RepID=UPI003D1CC82F